MRRHSDDIEGLESLLDKVTKDISTLLNLSMNLHGSAKRSGSQVGYRKVINKLEVLAKFSQDAKKELKNAKSEHLNLLNLGKDSPSDQNYNYDKVNFRDLPVKKR